MGMIGGGNGFYWSCTPCAANLDGQIDLVCGCFSGTPSVSVASGRNAFLAGRPDLILIRR